MQWDSGILLLVIMCQLWSKQAFGKRRTSTLENSLQTFITNTRSRIKSSSDAYEQNLNRALDILNAQSLDTKVSKRRAVRRIGDARLPYILEEVNNHGPQAYSNQSHVEIARPALRYIIKQWGSNISNPWIWASAKRYQKVQDALPYSTPFPCSIKGGRSPQRPTTVDKLRAGDIDAIGAMGDSIMAGFGLIGVNLLHFFIVNEGLTAVTGGYKNWRKIMTLANMIKVFNPNLTGYGTHDSLFTEGYDPKSFNVAVPASLVDDFPNMAKTLVNKMKRDSRVNFEKDWKLVVYYGGNVDMCADLCYWKNLEDAPAYHYKLMEQALDYLMANSPRTLVYFMITPNVPQFLSTLTKKSALCEGIIRFECSCLYGEIFRKHKDKYIQLMEKIIDVQVALVNHPKYQQKVDFAIVADPLLTNVSYSMRNTVLGQQIDYRYLSVDCFHLSQRAHAGVANSLWNSLWTPVGQKKRSPNWNTYEEMKCPTPDRPYIATPRNSAQTNEKHNKK